MVHSLLASGVIVDRRTLLRFDEADGFHLDKELLTEDTETFWYTVAGTGVEREDSFHIHQSYLPFTVSKAQARYPSQKDTGIIQQR